MNYVLNLLKAEIKNLKSFLIHYKGYDTNPEISEDSRKIWKRNLRASRQRLLSCKAAIQILKAKGKKNDTTSERFSI